MGFDEDPETNCEPGNGVRKPRSISYKLGFLLLALVLMAVIILLPSPPSLQRGGDLIPLSWSGKATLGLLAAAIVLWISEVIPFSVTALLILLFIPALGIDSFKNVIRIGFGNEIMAFLIGVLILSSAFSRSGMGNRLTYIILSVLGISTKMVVLGFLLIGTLLSMWVTDMAVAAMLMPLGVSILRRAGIKPLESNAGKGLMISCAWGPLFGGIATPSGCAPNPLTISYLKQLANMEIDFVAWTSLGLPASLLMIPVGWLVITKAFPPEIERLPISRETIKKELREMGPFSHRERWTSAIFLITICTWLAAPSIRDLTGGRIDIPMQAAALGGALLLFLPGIEAISWKEAQQDVDWGGIVLICAGISLGTMVYNTGAARWLSWVILAPVVGMPGITRVFAIVLVVSILHMAFSSNTVTGTIIIPLLIVLATDLKINPWLVCAPAGFASSLAFILVTETPTNVIPYSAGYFSIKDMAKAGIVMTVAAALCVGISLLIVGRLSGNYIAPS